LGDRVVFRLAHAASGDFAVFQINVDEGRRPLPPKPALPALPALLTKGDPYSVVQYERRHIE
jgi:hypothetical protein